MAVDARAHAESKSCLASLCMLGKPIWGSKEADPSLPRAELPETRDSAF